MIRPDHFNVLARIFQKAEVLRQYLKIYQYLRICQCLKICRYLRYLHEYRKQPHKHKGLNITPPDVMSGITGAPNSLDRRFPVKNYR